MRNNFKILRGLFLVFIGIPVGLILLWLVIGNLVASYLERRESREWGKEYVALDEIPAKYSIAQNNATAKWLVENGLKIGIRFVPLKENETETDARVIAYKAIREPLNDYFKVALAAPSDRLAEPTPATRAYLAANCEGVKVFRDYLLSHEPPAWESDLNAEVNRGFDRVQQPMQTVTGINFPEIGEQYLGTLNLMRLNAACGALAVLENNFTDANQYSNALERISAGISSDAQFVSKLLSLAPLHLRLGLLRKIPSEYANPVKEINYEFRPEQLDASHEIDVWMNRELLRRAPVHYDWRKHPFMAFFALLLRPSFRIMATDYSARARKSLKLVMTEDACTLNGEKFAEDPRIKPPKWSLVAQIMLPSLHFGNWRFSRAQQEAELTRLIQQAKQQHLITEKYSERSYFDSRTICQGHHWMREVSSDGQKIHIHYDQEMAWPPQKGLVLASEYLSDTPLPKQ